MVIHISFFAEFNKKKQDMKISEKTAIRIDKGLSFFEAIFTGAFVLSCAVGVLFVISSSFVGAFVEFIK